MAVVKANYVKRGVGDRGRAKSTIRYIQERPGKEKEKLTRQLFGADGTISREQAYRMIDEATKGTLFYRFVISPDPNREDSPRDLDLTGLTNRTITELEERLKSAIFYAAAIHDDHTPNRHVHVVALLSRKLSREDINFLRQRATEATQLQRRVLDLARGRIQSPRHALTARFTPARGAGARLTHRHTGLYSAPPWRAKPACPVCSEGNGLPMRRISENLNKCTSCGIIVRQTGLGMEIEQNSGWGRGIGQSRAL